MLVPTHRNLADQERLHLRRLPTNAQVHCSQSYRQVSRVRGQLAFPNRAGHKQAESLVPAMNISLLMSLFEFEV
jgi:hypothetical protein